MTETAEARSLGEEIGGDVVIAEDEGWDGARQAYNLAHDQRPPLVALPTDSDDVARIVSFARERGLRVAPQRTGHNAEPIESLDDVVLLNTKLMQGVEIDAEGRTCRVSAGAIWSDVVPDASDLGLAALHGSAPTVGIAGYTLGGGLGFYARKHGLAANSVRAIELVNADGEKVRTDPDNEPELFWALRGGGGNFGVVTALEFDLYPIAQVWAGALFFDFERSAEVLNAWREWTETVPEEVTSVGRMMQFPPIPDVPEPLRGNSFAIVEVIQIGTEEEAAKLVAPLRDLGPAMDTLAMVPPVGIAELHMDPPDPLPYVGGHSLLGADLPADAIDAFVDAGGPGSGSPLISVELRQLGGALARREPDAGALAALDAGFLYFGVGMKDSPESGAATDAQLDRMRSALSPWDAGSRYLNFVEEAADPAAFWDRDSYPRLRRARAQYDPDGVFRANHEIPLAA